MQTESAESLGRAAPARLLGSLQRVRTIERVGRVAEAFGTLIRATGIKAAIGEQCRIRNPENDFELTAEVVGIAGGHTLLTPLGSLEGMSPAARVVSTGERAAVQVGPGLCGRILDAHGAPIDGLGELVTDSVVPLYAEAPDPLKRTLIDKPLVTGVRAIDLVLTLGIGQRIGIFAPAGGGKSTLLGMMARNSDADINVVVLVGERGREVREFVDYNLGPEGLARSVLVVATSDRPALERSRAAYLGTAVAEYFRAQGASVLLLVDSVTRFARALRDVGLAVGEHPVRRGFTPSVFSALPALFERAGTSERGAITAVYSVLVEGEDDLDPIVEETRAILDGHVHLSRKLAAAAHYPAIDVLASASRVMPNVVQSKHQGAADALRKSLAKYADIELLLKLGEYQAGSDADADKAIEREGPLRKLLTQPPDERSNFDEALTRLLEITA